MRPGLVWVAVFLKSILRRGVYSHSQSKASSSHGLSGMGQSKSGSSSGGQGTHPHPGYALALAHCTRCHGLPTPQQPRETWPFVMTWMSNYLLHQSLWPLSEQRGHIQIPSQPMVSESELQAISVYLLYAPLEVRPDERSTALRPGSLKQFTPRPLPCKCPRTKSSP